MCPHSYLHQHLLGTCFMLIIYIFYNLPAPIQVPKTQVVLALIVINFVTSISSTFMTVQRQEVPSKAIHPPLKYCGPPVYAKRRPASERCCPSLRPLPVTLSSCWTFVQSDAHLSSLFCLLQRLLPSRKMMFCSGNRNLGQPKGAKPPSKIAWCSQVSFSLEFLTLLQVAAYSPATPLCPSSLLVILVTWAWTFWPLPLPLL